MKPKYSDQQVSRIQRLIRNKALRLLWFVALLVIAAFQVMMFLRLRRQGLAFFHSTLEMALVVALVTVALLGVVVKSRQNRRN
jgi:cytochrome bd-type quinol oxidase subunit 2